ncbi:MAG: ABC transporter permease subunit [Turicibacter sp.]|nr:ABC transporter permease subunit [Turicibacter sp.]
MIKYELRKIYKSPVVWGLMVVFTLFNGLLIAQNFTQRQSMSQLTDFTANENVQINEESLSSLYQMKVEGLAAANERAGTEFESAGEFFAQRRDYPNEVRAAFAEVLTLEIYYDVARNADEIMAGNDMVAFTEQQIAMIGATGELADTLRAQGLVAQARIAEILGSGTHRDFFFDGVMHATHSHLFGTVLRAAAFESMIFMVLVTAFLIGYEFDAKTVSVVYSTKTGRKLQGKKLVSALLAMLGLTTLLIAIILGIYFTVYNHSGLWGASMTSIFLSEFDAFYATFWDWTFLQYLLAVVGTLFVLQTVFVLLAFGLSAITRNSFLVPILFALLFGGLLLTGTFISAGSNWLLYTMMTPAHLLLRFKNLFMVTQLFPFYEVSTLLIWLGFGTVSSAVAYKKFLKEDLA